MHSPPLKATVEAAEWFVASSSGAIVRRGKGHDTALLGRRPLGAVVVGREEGDWLALPDRAGYVQLRLSRWGDLLKRRSAVYTKVSTGTCADTGKFSINDVSVCEAAGAALGLKVAVADSIDLGTSPEGCFVQGKNLVLGSSNSKWSPDMEPEKEPICSTQAYPTARILATPRDNVEWQVTWGQNVNVRAETSMKSRILSEKTNGTVIIGKKVADYVALSGEHGYIKIEVNGLTLLKPRHVAYLKLTSGTCKKFGLFAINSESVCQAAAIALGLPDNTTSVFKRWSAPESCYWRSGEELGHDHLVMVKTKGFPHEARNWEPLCSTGNYPKPELFSSDKVETFTLPHVTTITTTRPTTTLTKEANGLTTIVKPPEPSLFCFSVMLPRSEEQKLVTNQLNRSLSIWACDETMVICKEKVWLGKDKKGGDVWTWVNKADDLSIGDLAAGAKTNSWLNTLVFIRAFATIIWKGNLWKHDWVVKADPDAVFFPDRLRKHVANYTGKSAYFANCYDKRPRLYGAVEVYSKQAMGAFQDNQKMCQKKLPWHGWGEDYYMEHCLDMIGVRRISDFKLVGDWRCMGAPCTDGWRAAFHPFKDWKSYWHCWCQSAKSPELCG